MQRRCLKFVGSEYSPGFVRSPGEVVAIVVEVNVGVLGGVEAAAFTVAQPLVHPAHNVASNMEVILVAEHLVSVYIVLQQLRVVVGHLLEVRHGPVLVNRVTMEAATKLVIHSTLRHFAERSCDHGSDALFLGARVPIQQQVDGGSVWKLGCAAEAAVLLV